MGSRVLGIDVGRRRVGFAISDPTQTLARPLTTIEIGGADLVDQLADEITRLDGEDDGLAAVVVGMPRHLDGSPSEETAHVRQVMDRLRCRTPVPLFEIDERLTSREAESRLAVREPDWRKRKKRLDAAAAAILLQDYLDHR